MCLEFEMNSKSYLVLRNGYEYAEAEGRQKAEPGADPLHCNQRESI